MFGLSEVYLLSLLFILLRKSGVCWFEEIWCCAYVLGVSGMGRLRSHLSLSPGSDMLSSQPFKVFNRSLEKYKMEGKVHRVTKRYISARAVLVG